MCVSRHSATVGWTFARLFGVRREGVFLSLTTADKSSLLHCISCESPRNVGKLNYVVLCVHYIVLW